jgi:hypothetical protein
MTVSFPPGGILPFQALKLIPLFMKLILILIFEGILFIGLGSLTHVESAETFYALQDIYRNQVFKDSQPFKLG